MEVKKDQRHISPPSLPTKTIPVFDLGDPDDDLVVSSLVKASQEWGAFQVVNHGIPPELIKRLQEVGKEFFQLSAAEKEAVADSKSFEGYEAQDLKQVKAWNDHLLHKIWPPTCINYKHWPKNPPDYREVTEEYAKNVTRLSETIMGCLSKGLGLPREALKEGLGCPEYMLRINYYPPLDSVIGAPAHSDLAALALLVSNEVPGLQVYKDNQWFDVEYINSAVVVLIGDQIMRMSNGKYKNVLHRSTMDMMKMRMTWPVLVNPGPGWVVGPLPELTGGKNPPKFESLTFEDYVYRKSKNLLPLSG